MLLAVVHNFPGNPSAATSCFVRGQPSRWSSPADVVSWSTAKAWEEHEARPIVSFTCTPVQPFPIMRIPDPVLYGFDTTSHPPIVYIPLLSR